MLGWALTFLVLAVVAGAVLPSHQKKGCVARLRNGSRSAAVSLSKRRSGTHAWMGFNLSGSGRGGGRCSSIPSKERLRSPFTEREPLCRRFLVEATEWNACLD